MSIFNPAHAKAKSYVQTFQDPFGQFLSTTIDPINAAQKAGTLTYDQAKAALDAFNSQWTAFDQASQQFASMGGDYAKVVRQAYDPSKDFMKTVSAVRSQLTQLVGSLPPSTASDVKGATPPDPTKPPG